MKRLLAYSAVCVTMLAAASVSFAQQTGPCDEDIARFCANLSPGMGQLADCLKQHEAELSPECRQMHLSEIADVIRQTQNACGDDIVRFCGSVLQQSGYPLLNCLKLNSTGLSSDCRTKLFDALRLMHYY